MTRYIAIPKENTALAMLSLADVGFSKKARSRQI